MILARLSYIPAVTLSRGGRVTLSPRPWADVSGIHPQSPRGRGTTHRR